MKAICFNRAKWDADDEDPSLIEGEEVWLAIDSISGFSSIRKGGLNLYAIGLKGNGADIERVVHELNPDGLAAMIWGEP